MRFLKMVMAYVSAVFYILVSVRVGFFYIPTVILSAVFALMLSTFALIMLLIRGSVDVGLQPQTLVLHGLSFEEWRNAEQVANKIQQSDMITGMKNDTDTSFVFLALLLLSVADIALRRIEDDDGHDMLQKNSFTRLLFDGHEVVFKRKPGGTKKPEANSAESKVTGLASLN